MKYTCQIYLYFLKIKFIGNFIVNNFNCTLFVQ